jgi:hypothetical protein
MAMDTGAVVKTVQEALEQDPRFASLFEAFEEGAHEEQGFWFVPVRLSSPQMEHRRFEIYARFAELEEYLQTNHKLKVVLLPVLSRDIA